MSASPDKVLDTSGGDVTQQRFHYQAAYAALEAIRLMDKKLKYDSIYCEQIEDILVKLRTGKFIGIQVKSQKDGKSNFTFNHDFIITALRRFLDHEKRFSNKFKSYLLVTNCPFAQDKDATNLTHCISLIKEHGNLEDCYDEADFSRTIEKLKEEIDYEDDLIVKTLKKTQNRVWLSLSEYEQLLPVHIMDTLNYYNEPFAVSKRIAEELTRLTGDASRFRHLDIEPAYYKWLTNPEKTNLDLNLQNKRITKQKVESILNQCKQPPGVLQGLNPSLKLANLPRNMDVLSLKMQRGGITEDEIATTKECDHAALKLLLGWGYTYPGEADNMIEHLRLMVQYECSDAYNRKYDDSGKLFGRDMLLLLRDKLRERRAEVIQTYPNCGCTIEHLEGIAGMLTENCTTWWSKKFDIKSAGGTSP